MDKRILLALATSVALVSDAGGAQSAQVGAATGASTETAVMSPAEMKAAEKARAKQVAQWKAQYGEGPYPDETEAFVSSRPDALKPYWQTLYTGGERNAVLNFSRLGLAAMEIGDWRTAEKAFDSALTRIEAVYAKDAAADAARSTFRKEANKDFKGEPYERSMAYYYRGLLYLRKGDYDNARASFKGAEFQDTISEEENFQSDFAVMNYLIGWSSRCAGDNGEPDFDVAVATQPGLAKPGPKDNVLVLTEIGTGPMKVKDGAQKQKLVFQPVSGLPETNAEVWLDAAAAKPVSVQPMLASSVNFQATTRGGRAMDGVLNGKASFKETTGTIGNVGMQMGLSMMNNSNSGTAGMAMMAAGAMFSMFSSAAKADADIRHWDTLPDGLALSTVAYTGKLAPKVTYMSPNGPVPLGNVPVMQAMEGKCGIVWSRSRSALVDAATPGEDLNVARNVARNKNSGLKNKRFRDELVTNFGA